MDARICTGAVSYERVSPSPLDVRELLEKGFVLGSVRYRLIAIPLGEARQTSLCRVLAAQTTGEHPGERTAPGLLGEC